MKFFTVLGIVFYAAVIIMIGLAFIVFSLNLIVLIMLLYFEYFSLYFLAVLTLSLARRGLGEVI